MMCPGFVELSSEEQNASFYAATRSCCGGSVVQWKQNIFVSTQTSVQIFQLCHLLSEQASEPPFSLLV